MLAGEAIRYAWNINDIPIEYENPITIKRANEVSNEISHLRNINCNASLS